MNHVKTLAVTAVVLFALVLTSCRPTYVYREPRYGPPYGNAWGHYNRWYRPAPPVVVVPPPRVYYRQRVHPRYRYYRPAPPRAYQRQDYGYGNGNGRRQSGPRGNYGRGPR